MVDRTALRDLAQALPKGSGVLVPREWMLELLGQNMASVTVTPPPVDLTAAEVAQMLGRKEVTIRSWCAGGQLPGCYRLNHREWRIPRSTLEGFLTRQSEKAAR